VLGPWKYLLLIINKIGHFLVFILMLMSRTIYLADETSVHVLVKEDNVTGVHRFRWNVFINISMQN
jgi:hypothetical protein